MDIIQKNDILILMKRPFIILSLLFLIFSCRGKKDVTTDNNISISEQEIYPDLSRNFDRFWINFDGYNLDLKSYIEMNPNLSELIITFKDYQSIDFSLLLNLKYLNELTLDCYDNSLSQFPDLSGLEKLKRLTIFSTINSFENIHEYLPNIEYFRFYTKDQWELEIKNLYEISKITSLKEIFFQMSTKQDISFLKLQGLTNLEIFKTFTGGIIDFEGIGNLNQLKYISAEYCTPKNIDHLGNLSLLQKLELRIVNGNIKFLENIITLERLTLENYEFNRIAGSNDGLKNYQTKIDLYSIRNLRVLNYISLSGFIIDNVHIIDTLPSLNKGYYDVYFCDCFVLPNNSVEKLNTSIYRDFTPDR